MARNRTTITNDRSTIDIIKRIVIPGRLFLYVNEYISTCIKYYSVELEQEQAHINSEIINLVAGGDEKAFAVLFATMVPLLRPGIWKLVRSEDIFREILQEAFLKIWLHRDQLPEIEKPENWIYRIVANECFNWLNKEARRHQQAKLASGDQSLTNISTEHYIITKETQSIIQQAIDALPKQKRTIYLLSRTNGLKTAEIARQLNVSHSYVRNAISESLRFIRQYLKQAGQLIVIASLFR